MRRVQTLSRTITHHVERQDERQRPLDVRLIQRVMSFMRPHRSLRDWLLAMVLIRSIQLPALTWAVAAVINGPVARHDVRGVLWGAVGFLVLALTTQWVMYYRQLWALQLGEVVVGDMRIALFRHIQSLRMKWFHDTRVGRLISRMVSDIEDVRAGVQEVLFVSLVQIGQMIVAAAAMLWYDWTLFLIIVGLAPILWLINSHFHRRMSIVLRNVRESFSRVTATLAESVVGIRVTQAFAREEENSRLFADLAADHSTFNTDLLRTQGLFLPLLQVTNQLFLVILMLVGGYRVLSPDSTMRIGDLVGFFFMANLFFSPILILGNQYNMALTAMAGAERLFALLDQPPDWTDPPDALRPETFRGDVEFRDVTFGYNPERPVLRNITFHAAPGQTIALVGQTGSGKSSLINLLAKFYLPQQGEILIDGLPLSRIHSDALHRHLGIVLQQNFLFYGTVADNVRFGKLDATDTEIQNVFARLGCGDLLTTLPQGLDTHVGERGGTLSAGQRQLICFARALIADPQILILDEATSCVDSATEARLQRALEILVAGRTSFVVAHRLSTIRNADQVLVLDHGRIVERGRHAELIELNGPYAALHRRFAME